jgi:hypothetical protein
LRGAAFAVVAALAPVRAQEAVVVAPEPSFIPFRVGERMTYDVNFGFLRAGNASIELAGTDTVRGRSTFHAVFTVRGGVPFYRVHDVLQTWFDTAGFHSLRFRSDQDEGGRKREKAYEIFPDRAMYIEEGRGEKPGVSDPLDDASFLYFVRTLDLQVGRTYEIPRYFRPDRNPVKVIVLRKEAVEVPAGRFNTIVVQPIIKTNGIFKEGGRAELWLSDDTSRVVVQLKSKLSFGSLNLYLKSWRPGGAAPP